MKKEHNEAAKCETKLETASELGATVTDGMANLAGEAASLDTGQRILQLEAELDQAKQSIDESYNRMLRVQADFDNFRKRSRQEFEQVCLCAGEDLVKKILPVIDSLERATNCFTEQGDNCSWQEGVELTLKQFQNILAVEGLEAVPALNELFDPQVHEAVAQEEAETVSEATVIAELQKGYKFKGKLIRPALVKVAVPRS